MDGKGEASRKRVAALLGCESENLGKILYQSVAEPIPPVEIFTPAPCQEVIHKADERSLICIN